MNHLLNPISPPALPLAREQYDRPYQDQLNNVLRLYFEKLNSNLNNLTNTTGGRHVEFPYGAFSSTANTTFTANTPKVITINTTDYDNGFTLASNKVTAAYNGLYNIQFSLQFVNEDVQAHNTWVWLRKNGTDIAGTASKIDVPSSHGSSHGYLIFSCNFFVNLIAMDYIELVAATVDAKVYLEAYAASTSPFTVPAVPSAVLTLAFVSTYEV